MNNTTFIVTIVFLLSIVARIAAWILTVACEEIKTGARKYGFAIIGVLVTIVLGALPWCLL